MLAETLPEPRYFVHAGDVLVHVGIIVVSMAAIVLAYHAMQRPRLLVTEVEPGRWRARRRDVWKYVLSIPWQLLLWMAGLELILVFANNGLSGVEVSIIAVSLVIAVRVLAHVAHEHAHELAKTVPLTVVTLFLVSGNGMRNEVELDKVLQDWNATALTAPTNLLLIGTEFAVAALWYWVGVRWWWARGHDLVGMPRHRALDARSPAPPPASPPADHDTVVDAEPPSSGSGSEESLTHDDVEAGGSGADDRVEVVAADEVTHPAQEGEADER